MKNISLYVFTQESKLCKVINNEWLNFSEWINDWTSMNKWMIEL